MFDDVSADSEEDFRTHDTDTIQNRLLFKTNQKFFKKEIRRKDPILGPIVENETKEIGNTSAIIQLRYSGGFPNLVTIRNRMGKGRLCIDFRNLKKSSMRDCYPLSQIDHMLPRVVVSKEMSLFDSISGCNQVMVLSTDQRETSSTTPWGTYLYDQIPFGLMKESFNFQEAMENFFPKDLGYFTMLYLDDIIIYFKTNKAYLLHLQKVFERDKFLKRVSKGEDQGQHCKFGDL